MNECDVERRLSSGVFCCLALEEVAKARFDPRLAVGEAVGLNDDPRSDRGLVGLIFDDVDTFLRLSLVRDDIDFNGRLAEPDADDDIMGDIELLEIELLVCRIYAGVPLSDDGPLSAGLRAGGDTELGLAIPCGKLWDILLATGDILRAVGGFGWVETGLLGLADA